MKKIIIPIIFAVLFYHAPLELKRNIKEKVHQGYVAFRQFMDRKGGETRESKTLSNPTKEERTPFQNLIDMDIVDDNFKEKARQTLSGENDKIKGNPFPLPKVLEDKKDWTHDPTNDTAKLLEEMQRKLDEISKVMEDQ